MKLQVLSSGSEGNSTLVRAGELSILVDAGLSRVAMEERLESARLAPGAIAHVLVTHGHLDHARSAGMIARRERATLHCAEAMMTHASARRAKRLSTIRIGVEFELKPDEGDDRLRATPVPIPHDCDPTVAYRLEHQGRVAVILTDMGRVDDVVARRLNDAHVLVLEFNHDPALMETSPYPAVLRKRILGNHGHLSNAQGAAMLERMASPNLHTLVLAHLSQKTNTRELALAAAHGALERLGLTSRVRVIVAEQHEALETLEV
ncbi:MAG: MBL fold metallo-hydrolase [Planctomycetes bacterium]|nr:MBL fold metallo-hydrolase [Planctomycetota bacterium]